MAKLTESIFPIPFLLFVIFGSTALALVEHFQFSYSKNDADRLLTKISVEENREVQANCGQRMGTENAFKIIGGSQAAEGQFPWAVSLLIVAERSEEYAHLCTGLIISQRHVLTASHCFNLCEQLDSLLYHVAIAYGGVNLNCTELSRENCPEAARRQEGMKMTPLVKIQLPMRPAKRAACLHPADDYAILELSDKLEFTDRVRPICLVKNLKKKLVKNSVADIGWGVDESEKPSYVLRHKQTKILAIFNVPYLHENGSLASNVHHPGYIMARGLRKKTDSSSITPTICKGDSGGPLLARAKLAKKGERSILLGIHSLGSFPGVCEASSKLGIKEPEGITDFDWQANAFVPGFVDEVCHWTGVCPDE